MELSHRAVVATVVSLKTFLDSHAAALAHRDSLLSFLPLAHIFDRHTAVLRSAPCLLPVRTAVLQPASTF